MTFIKIDLKIWGDEFSPRSLLSSLDQSLQVVNITEIGDAEDGKIYDFGYLEMSSTKELGYGDEFFSYQESYVNFVVAHYKKIIENKGTDIELFYNVYYSEQCNFEIMDKEMLKIVASIGVSIPISIYRISDSEYSSWLSRIERNKY